MHRYRADDHDEVITKLTRGFPGENFLEQIRVQVVRGRQYSRHLILSGDGFDWGDAANAMMTVTFASCICLCICAALYGIVALHALPPAGIRQCGP